MPAKYVFVTGGVVSGLGKGITAASLGRLLKARGYRVSIQKLDPYLNVDPGTMNPFQHGEVFVTEDGAETDLDSGHYERFIDENLDRFCNVTSGKVYQEVIARERAGEYAGSTVQVIPHITGYIKEQIASIGDPDKVDVAIVEIGGTVGDIESQPFLEAIRQFSIERGRGNCAFVHVTLIPFLKSSGELKTKPTQHSVQQLQGTGIQPNIIVCRCEHPVGREVREKISLFCNVPLHHVIANRDTEVLYEVPLKLEQEDFAQTVLETLDSSCPEPRLDDWRAMVEALKTPRHTVRIAMVGKYVALHDAYLSVVEALKHGGVPSGTRIEIAWVDSETVTRENARELLEGVHGILIPGGFGIRGVEGKIEVARFAREQRIPYLGICLGLQVAVIEFARNVAGLEGAHGIEFDPSARHPVIHLMPDQDGVVDLGGTLRLGSYPCRLEPGSKAYSIYNKPLIHERHRHRYEFNNAYRKVLSDAGLRLCGLSPDGHIVEMVELPDHPWHVSVQFHPEFKSRPNRPHPLFRSFVEASLEHGNA
ncbi:MAG: CTP synthase [Clostridiales bacterium]|nr:CTP synthase [Clostridiales bacterium]